MQFVIFLLQIEHLHIWHDKRSIRLDSHQLFVKHIKDRLRATSIQLPMKTKKEKTLENRIHFEKLHNDLSASLSFSLSLSLRSYSF